MKKFTAFAVLYCSMFSVAAHADLVTISNNHNLARANNQQSGQNESFFTGTQIPTQTVLNAISGQNVSSNTIDWSVQQGVTRFMLDITHQRDGTFESVSQTGNDSQFFTVDDDLEYRLEGFYHTDGMDLNVAGRAVLEVLLADRTDNSILFRNVQDSRNTISEQFELGETGGDTTNILTGDLEGVLLKDHQYELYMNIHIMAYSQADAGASADGQLQLLIGDGINKTEVPECSSFGMICLFGSVAALWRRRRELAA